MNAPAAAVAEKHRDLIVDIGVSDGADSDFYLKKGFNVVGVEADPVMCQRLRERFAQAIAEGRYMLLNRAAHGRSGETLSFFINRKAQGHSRVLEPGKAPQREGEVTEAVGISWGELIGQFGIPYFVKVDIEGAEAPFLGSIRNAAQLPKFFSVEAHAFDPIEALYRVGYRHFRLINQTLHHRFEMPDPPREGTLVAGHRFQHASGLFGEELPGNRWYSFRELCGLWTAIEAIRAAETIIGNVWFDCHAMLPEW